MLKRFTLLSAILLSLTVAFAQHTNILINDLYSPNEPSINIDPKNPNRMVAAHNVDLFYISDDGGYTWTVGDLNSPLGVWGDPCIVVDTLGNFYFFHLSSPPQTVGHWIDRIVCQRTNDLGATWTEGSGIGYVAEKEQDKEWAVVNPYNNEIYVTWTQFDNYGTSNPNDSTIIRFSKSTDLGETWTEPVRLSYTAGDCIDSDNTVEGAVPTVGPEGQIYVSWSGPAGIVFDRSLDGGATWLNQDIPVTPHIGGWDQYIPGIQRCNGMPVTDCDRSNGPNKGTIYINYTDQKNGETDTDVWLTKSTDGGNTWSEPKRVNDDPPGRHQFFTWMTVDQVTGKLWFVFYDRRNHPDNMTTDVYMAVSSDGGETFTNFKVSEEPFSPQENVFFGDYNNIAATNDIVRPIWTRLHNSQLSLYTAIINPLVIGTQQNENLPYAEEQVTPNPFGRSTAFSFKLRHAANVSLQLVDVTGRTIAHLITNKQLEPGKYTKILEAEGYNLNPGVYYFMLNADNKISTKKVVYTP